MELIKLVFHLQRLNFLFVNFFQPSDDLWVQIWLSLWKFVLSSPSFHIHVCKKENNNNSKRKCCLDGLKRKRKETPKNKNKKQSSQKGGEGGSDNCMPFQRNKANLNGKINQPKSNKIVRKNQFNSWETVSHLWSVSKSEKVIYHTLFYELNFIETIIKAFFIYRFKSYSSNKTNIKAFFYL